jgi:ABC-2 type transport system permease protein
MHYLRMIFQFLKASIQEETMYRANFWIHLLHSLLSLATGFLGIYILFGQIEMIEGWTFAGALAILGVYLTVQALRGLFIGPSLDALAGMDGEVWNGSLDFTLLRPVDIQFLASFRKWRLFALFDLLLGLVVIFIAGTQLQENITGPNLILFLVSLLGGVTILYSILLVFTAFVFWSPGILFTWIFDGVFQLARYPLGLYPGWVRLALTWIIPVGVVTTFPAQAFTGTLPPSALITGLLTAALLLIGSSLFFRLALRRYASAAS